MSKRIINLRYAATCADCGAPLIPGDRARYYGRGKTYGVDCHTKAESAERAMERPARFENAGHRASHYDPTGFYTAGGTLLGRRNPAGRCEDAPCCGCCT